MKNYDEYCRKNREKSISPSISLDLSQNTKYTEEEKYEKIFFSSTISEMFKEIFMSFDDLARNINHFLVKNLKATAHKRIPDNYWDDILERFFEYFLKMLTSSLDEGEYKCNKILKLKDEDRETAKYIKSKGKRKSLIPIFKGEVSELNLFSPLKKLEEENMKYVKMVKENLSLRIEIALQKKIQYAVKNNFTDVKERFHNLGEQIKNKPDMSYIEKNVDTMMSKLKMMKRELEQIPK